MLLISSLERGGAERQVVELVRRLDRSRFAPFVCTLSAHNPLADRLPNGLDDVVVVDKRFKYDLSTVRRVRRVMAERNVGLVHAFLFDAEMVARLAGGGRGGPVVVCSERNTDYVRPAIHSICYRLTRGRSDGVIANSHAGKAFVVRTLGLRERDVFVVPNGVDADRFLPGDGSAVRRSLGIGADDPVVGMVASFKRQKNHAMFFEMADRVWRRFERAWFVCVGEPLRDNVQGAEDYHREVRELLATMAVRERVLMPGARDDIEDVYRACDVTVLTSRHEGTPNVLLESMASEVPVVATDVSDNARVVADGETGFVVNPDDADAMAERVCMLLGDGALRSRLGKEGRRRVTAQFSPEVMAERTGEIYELLLKRKGRSV